MLSTYKWSASTSRAQRFPARNEPGKGISYEHGQVELSGSLTCVQDSEEAGRAAGLELKDGNVLVSRSRR